MIIYAYAKLLLGKVGGELLAKGSELYASIIAVAGEQVLSAFTVQWGISGPSTPTPAAQPTRCWKLEISGGEGTALSVSTYCS